MTGRLEEKVAIVTGAGRGLGEAFALRYFQEGAKLLLPDISLERAERTAREIRDKGGRAVAMEADIADEGSTRAVVERVLQEFGKVDILLNNAALSYGIEPRPWDAWTVELCVNSIAPGMTATEANLIQPNSDQLFAATIAAQCIKRREEPDDLVEAAVFLASDGSGFVTGQLLCVDGGAVLA